MALSAQFPACFHLLGAGFCILIIAFRHTTWSLGLPQAGLNLTVLELGTAFMLIAMQQRYDGGNARPYAVTGVFRWFGRNSYEVYLTHMLVVWPLMRIFFDLRRPGNAAPLWFAGITALAGLLGYVGARFYSEPLNSRLRAH